MARAKLKENAIASARARAPAPAPTRAAWLDALRGLAIFWMVAYHFFFDLNYFGLLQPPHNFSRDALWTIQRTLIVGLFLFSAGLGQALAVAAGQGWPRFWRRWAQVVGCAMLVSLSSAWFSPGSWISFGVLHGMAVMLPIARVLGLWLQAGPGRAGQVKAWQPCLIILLAMLALSLPWLVQHPFFDSRAFNWVGLVTRKPFTLDFVPVLPWLGVVLAGLLAGLAGLALTRRRGARPGVSLPAMAAPLIWLGQRPLLVYMVHQPLLMGLIWLALRGLR